jgi:hypothetical protein
MSLVIGYMRTATSAGLAKWHAITEALGLKGTHQCEGVSWLRIAALEGKGPHDLWTDSSSGLSLVSGRFFDKSPLTSGTDEAIGFVQTILPTVGLSIQNRFRGHYLALHLDNRTGDLLAVRDPMGGAEVLHHHDPDTGLFVIFQDFRFSQTIVGLGARLDRRCFQNLLHFQVSMPTTRTSIEQVRSLMPGQSLRVRCSDGAVQCDLPWWRQLARSTRRGSRDDLEQALVQITAKLLDRHPCPALYLSGGLDSSGLLGLIRSVDPDVNVTCIHYFTRSGTGDERDFANIAASSFGLEAFMVDCRFMSLDDRLADRYKRAARPYGRNVLSGIDAALEGAALADGCDSLWLGLGGDSIFVAEPRPAAVIDAFVMDGWAEAWRTAISLAVADQSQLAAVFSNIIPDVVGNCSFKSYLRGARSRFWRWWRLPPSFDKAAMTLMDRLLEGVKLPAKRARLLAIYLDVWATCEQRLHLGNDALSVVTPYQTEEVIEAAIGFDSHRCFNGVYDRFQFRLILSKYIPSELTHRNSKTGGDDFLMRGIQSKELVLTKQLLLGRVLKSGLIARQDIVVKPREFAATAKYNPIDLLLPLSIELVAEHLNLEIG